MWERPSGAEKAPSSKWEAEPPRNSIRLPVRSSVRLSAELGPSLGQIVGMSPLHGSPAARAPNGSPEECLVLRRFVISPYMKGRSRIKSLFLSIVPDSPIGVLHQSAGQRDVGSTSGDARRRLGVDAGGEPRHPVRGRLCGATSSHHCSGVLSCSRGQSAIHSSISAHDGVRPRPDGLNQKRRPHRGRWATALVEHASVRGRDSGGSLEASDLPARRA